MAVATRPASVYKGDTYRIPCSRGGWTANPAIDLIAPEMMTEALNINLHRGGRETRGGTTKVHASAITGTPRTMGAVQFRKKNGTTKIVTAMSDGTIWADYATLLKSGLTQNKVTTFVVFNDTLYICNGADRPQTWNGTAATTSNLTNIPTDWTGTNFPAAMVVHGRGVSQRLWAYGCPTDPEKVYASDNDTDDFSDANVVTLEIRTGDGFGVVALVEFGDRLIAIAKTRPFLIDDSDASTANWGYEAAQWEGGAASARLVVRTPNDVVVMGEDGDVYSIIATQATGDYAAVSLARPAHIHVWIEDHVDRSLLATEAHAVYDPDLRACKFFVVRQDESQVDTALVYFIDRPAEEAWVRHEYASEDFASCSAVVRASAGDFQVYVGGHDGFVRRLEDPDSALDDGTAYRNGFSTPELRFDDLRGGKRYDRGWLVMQRQGGESVAVNLYVDGVAVADSYAVVDESDNPVVDEDDNSISGRVLRDFEVTPSSAGRLAEESYALGIAGRRIQADVYGSEDGERFFISQMMFDHMPLGARAA